FLGLAALDLAGVLLQRRDALLRGGDRGVLDREHAAFDPRAARGAAERAEHLIERFGVLLDLDTELLDRAAALPARAAEPHRVARGVDEAGLGDLGHGQDPRRRERAIDERFG